MRFPPSFLEEIKARLPVSDVVRRRVKLIKAGREWKGLSPFNQEKTPSFYVNDQKQFFHDFSSGKHGSVFDFVMETEGLDFPEAVEKLAREAGLALPSLAPESQRREKQRATLHQIVELAVGYFENELEGPRGVRARAYLAERQIAPAQRKQFRLGYASGERAALRDWLAGRGVDLDLMVEAGLVIRDEGAASSHDRFRDRIMFPIADRSGRAIAFGGRALDRQATAKYLNSPETPLFHKGATLYNFHTARQAAHAARALVVVEGYVDVIALAGVGFAHVVAPLGTALTADQCALLWSAAEEPILCFDGDKAGRRAAERAIDTALPLIAPGKTLRFAFLPDGMDPDDLARSGGAEAIEATLASAKPLAEVLWMREFAAGPLDTPERRAGLELRAHEAVRRIQDEALRRHYRDDFDARLRTLRGVGTPAGTLAWAPGGAGRMRSGRSQRRKAEPIRGYVGSKPMIGASLARSATFVGRGAPPREASILVLLMNHPALLARFAEELTAVEFSTPDLQRLRDALVELDLEDAQEAKSLGEALAARGLEAARSRAEAAAPLSSTWWAKPEADESDVYEVLRQAILQQSTRRLHKELEAATRELAANPSDAKLELVRDLQSELSRLDGREAAVEGFGASSGRQTRI